MAIEIAEALPGSSDDEVLRTADAWCRAGHRVWLATVIETHGSAPRPPGAMAAFREDGHVVGSVSGGCVEDDLVDWLRRDAVALATGRVLLYGQDAEERARLRLPCNGHLRVWLEPVDTALTGPLTQAVREARVVRRSLDLGTGAWTLDKAPPGVRTGTEGNVFEHVIGPVHRLVLVGAGDVSRFLAPIAFTLGFRVDVVDPREEYAACWPHGQCRLHRAMPDDLLLAEPPDARTAVVALSHDPKLDDLALIEALRFPCLYVGAMGSTRTTVARKGRLALFELAAEQIDRLHGPVGADIGARTPPEIAVSIAADLVAAIRRATVSSR